MSLIHKTIKKYVGNVVSDPTIKEVKYKIYWLAEKHCDQAEPVIQIDKQLFWRCEHYE